MSNTQVLPTKLTASATTLLTLAMLLASAQALTQSELKTFMVLANSGVTGKYVPLTTLAVQLKAQAVAMKSWADELHANGGDVNIQAFLNAHKAQIVGTINPTDLQKAYKAAVAAGYQGDINDYAKPAKGSTVAQRQAALNQMNQIGLYKMLVQVSEIFTAASAEASRLAEERRGVAHLVNAAYLSFILPRASCNELSVAIGLFAYAGLMTAELGGVGLAFGVVSIGVAVARDIYC